MRGRRAWEETAQNCLKCRYPSPLKGEFPRLYYRERRGVTSDNVLWHSGPKNVIFLYFSKITLIWLHIPHFLRLGKNPVPWLLGVLVPSTGFGGQREKEGVLILWPRHPPLCFVTLCIKPVRPPGSMEGFLPLCSHLHWPQVIIHGNSHPSSQTQSMQYWAL